MHIWGFFHAGVSSSTVQTIGNQRKLILRASEIKICFSLVGVRCKSLRSNLKREEIHKFVTLYRRDTIIFGIAVLVRKVITCTGFNRFFVKYWRPEVDSISQRWEIQMISPAHQIATFKFLSICVYLFRNMIGIRYEKYKWYHQRIRWQHQNFYLLWCWCKVR